VAFALRASQKVVKVAFLPLGYLLNAVANNITIDGTVMLQLVSFN
jgi:hypothetical protein